MVSFALKPRLSVKEAERLILDIAAYGNHNWTHQRFEYRYPTFWGLSEVKEFFKNRGIDFDSLVNETRHPFSPVPFLENLIRSKWFLSGTAEVKLPSVPGGDPDEVTVGPGQVAFPAFLDEFENSAASFVKAFEEKSIPNFNNAVVSGVTSIEVYLNNQIAAWNASNPNDQLVDDKQHKVPFGKKVTDLIPKIAYWQRLDKSERFWGDFVEVRDYRDSIIHRKQYSARMEYRELHKYLIKYRFAIPGLLFEMHKIFKQRVPSQIIRVFHTFIVIKTS